MLRIKRIVYLLLAVIIIQLTCIEKVYSKTVNYLAIGDSIAYGYGLEDTESRYAQIVKNELNIENTNYKNLSISGITCKKYYSIIQKSVYTNEIKNADLITISIGSNELLQVAAGGLSNVTGIDSNDTDFFSEIQEAFTKASISKRYDMAKKMYNYFESSQYKEQIDISIGVYEEYWDKLVNYIKKINPNASIIVTEFYNPYYGIKIGDYELGNVANDSIMKMNEILWARSYNEKEYKIAKIFDGFNSENPRLTNANANTSFVNFEINMDPHPNAEGHKLIAERIIEIINQNINNDSLNILQTVMTQQKQASVVKSKNTKIKYLCIAIFSVIIVIRLYKMKKNKR
ncbi:MAG: hypothetical protein IKG56_02305 [Clostridia bacterium]|nr:hypothetical protein [Clostridia bacterium]